MRIGIVSDAHCNVDGLRLALERMGDVDELLFAGDAIFQYRFSNEVVELLRGRGARLVLGNHDRVFLGPAGANARSLPHVRQDNVRYLASQPGRLDTVVSGNKLTMVHGSPFESPDDYLYAHSKKTRRLAEIDADYIVLGHTHVPMELRIGRALVINPGALADSREHHSGFALSCAILDTASGEVAFDRFHLAGGR
jgi:putative phosphoesterase